MFMHITRLLHSSRAALDFHFVTQINILWYFVVVFFSCYCISRRCSSSSCLLQLYDTQRTHIVWHGMDWIEFHINQGCGLIVTQFSTTRRPVIWFAFIIINRMQSSDRRRSYCAVVRNLIVFLASLSFPFSFTNCLMFMPHINSSNSHYFNSSTAAKCERFFHGSTQPILHQIKICFFL